MTAAQKKVVPETTFQKEPVCKLTKAQREWLLNPDYLSKAVGMFYRKRRPKQTFPELISDAVDFIMTGYKVPVIDMKRSRKDNRRAALEAHAAVSIYHRLVRVCRNRGRDPDEHLIPMSDLPEQVVAPPDQEPPLGSEEASRRLELLGAMLEYDDSPQAGELRQFLNVFAENLDARVAARSIGLTGFRLTGLFRWARRRYSSVLG